MATILDSLNYAFDRIAATAHGRCTACGATLCQTCRHPLSDHHYDDDGLWGCIAVDGRVAARSIATGAGPVCGCVERPA